MSLDLITGKFARIGARVKLRREALPRRMQIDVRRDQRGEYFDLAINAALVPRLTVLDVHPQTRHLLLLAEDAPHTPSRRCEGPQQYLFGHDGQLFVMPIKADAPIVDVRSALAALRFD